MAVSDTAVAPATTTADASLAATTYKQQQQQQTTAAQRTLSNATSNGSCVTDTSPSKRRGDDMQKQASVAEAETADDNDDDSTQPAKRARPDEQPAKVLPIRYELCAVDDMVELIAHMLNELIATNDAIRTTSGGLTRFHSRYVAAQN